MCRAGTTQILTLTLQDKKVRKSNLKVFAVFYTVRTHITEVGAREPHCMLLLVKSPDPLTQLHKPHSHTMVYRRGSGLNA